MILANLVSVSLFLITRDQFSLAEKSTAHLHSMWFGRSLYYRKWCHRTQGKPISVFYYTGPRGQRRARDSDRASEGRVAIFVGITGKEKNSLWVDCPTDKDLELLPSTLLPQRKLPETTQNWKLEKQIHEDIIKGPKSSGAWAQTAPCILFRKLVNILYGSSQLSRVSAVLRRVLSEMSVRLGTMRQVYFQSHHLTCTRRAKWM